MINHIKQVLETQREILPGDKFWAHDLYNMADVFSSECDADNAGHGYQLCEYVEPTGNGWVRIRVVLTGDEFQKFADDINVVEVL